jgi:very-short-patch-repair endonuclease
MEDRFLAICRRHRLPAPVRQHRIDGHDHDFAWPESRVVVETDGWAAHGTPYAFRADRARTNALQLQGWTVLRFTWQDLTDRPAQVAATVRRALAARRTTPSPPRGRPSPSRGGPQR